MKRKIFTLFLATLAALALAVPACADVIWTPNDSFYERHWEQCSYVGRSYELAGYNGTVTVFTAPGGMGRATLDNGLQGTVQFTWEGKGTTWGYLCWVDGSEVEGWVPTDDLSKVYDCQQFLEDRAGEIAQTQPVQVDFHEAMLYEYPNGPARYVLEEKADYQPFSETFSQIYTDGAGLRWGYIPYYMGTRNCWVCLDDPMNESLSGGVVPVSSSPAQLRGSATVTAGPSPYLIAAVLVAGVVAVTWVLLRKLKKRERP